MKERASSGDRVVYCDRGDCCFAGDAVPAEQATRPPCRGVPYFVCEAEIVVLDRRVKFGKTCGRFAKKA